MSQCRRSASTMLEGIAWQTRLPTLAVKVIAKPHRVTLAVGVAVVRFVRRESWML